MDALLALEARALLIFTRAHKARLRGLAEDERTGKLTPVLGDVA